MLLFLQGCSSSSYKVIVGNDGLVDVIASPDRILPYCEKVIKDDGTVSYGFMIFFLDEQKTAGAATGMLTDHKTCSTWKTGVQKVLESGKIITLNGFGNIEEPRIVEEFTYHFEKHGTFHSNSRSFSFFSIRNDTGHCFSVDPDRCKK